MRPILSAAIVFLTFTLQAADAATKPNILFLYTDDQTFDSIRALGNREVSTPNLDRLASSGAVFRNCYNQGGWHGAVCVASRTMLNTGRFLWEACSLEPNLRNEAAQNRFWPQLMRQAGYHTRMTGKWHVSGVQPADLFDETRHVRPGMPPSCDDAYERPKQGEPDLWQPWDESRGGHWQGGRHWCAVTADDTIGFLSAPPRGKPFFIYAAFNAPHDPRQSPKAFTDLYPPCKIALPPNFMPTNPYKDAIGCAHALRDERLAPDPRTPHAVQTHRAEYYALITYLDQQIGRVLEALEKSGQSTNTVVFLTGDNGLSVGQHGFMGKQNMFEHSMRVPLLAAGLGIPKGKIIDTPVYLQDVLPTTLELAGAEIPPYVRYKSLLPLLREGERAAHYDAIYGAYMGLQRMLRMGDMKLIWYTKPNVFLLFNLAKDPYELNDLAADPSHADVLLSLKKRLARYQKEVNDPCSLPVPE